MDTNTLPSQLPAFVSVKRIRADKIVGVSFPDGPGAVHLELQSGAVVTVPSAWIDRRLNGQGAEAAIGGFYVVYPDGYSSWSPADAFEGSCIPEAEWGLPLQQEPKYTVNLRGRLVNRASGNEIPPDEPVMLFRAQDRDARGAIAHYQEDAPTEYRRDMIAERVDAFEQFFMDNPERVKDAD